MTDRPAEAVTAEPPRAVRSPVMLQGWYDLTALHWRYEPAEVQALIPDHYRVDVFDGSAWVGLIPFHMRRIRIPGLPAFGRLSTFPETNVRTYIVDPSGRRGVWFFSLDVTRMIPALVARVTYRLPYCWADMSIAGEGGVGSTRRYESLRRWPAGQASSRVEIRIGPAMGDTDTTELDHFLTARWALGSRFGPRLLWADVDHPRWPLHHAEVLEWDETLVRAAGLSAPEGLPLARWSPGVEVRIGRPRLIRASRAG
jgi:uncharacterized protein YqjF (DUF2071 family)